MYKNNDDLTLPSDHNVVSIFLTSKPKINVKINDPNKPKFMNVSPTHEVPAPQSIPSYWVVNKAVST